MTLTNPATKAIIVTARRRAEPPQRPVAADARTPRNEAEIDQLVELFVQRLQLLDQRPDVARAFQLGYVYNYEGSFQLEDDIDAIATNAPLLGRKLRHEIAERFRPRSPFIQRCLDLFEALIDGNEIEAILDGMDDSRAAIAQWTKRRVQHIGSRGAIAALVFASFRKWLRQQAQVRRRYARASFQAEVSVRGRTGTSPEWRSLPAEPHQVPGFGTREPSSNM